MHAAGLDVMGDMVIDCTTDDLDGPRVCTPLLPDKSCAVCMRARHAVVQEYRLHVQCRGHVGCATRVRSTRTSHYEYGFVCACRASDFPYDEQLNLRECAWVPASGDVGPVPGEHVDALVAKCVFAIWRDLSGIEGYTLYDVNAIQAIEGFLYSPPPEPAREYMVLD
jgi:hypothetical protein